MGAEAFHSVAVADSAGEAYDACVDMAHYDHGHSGYSGTIAEKGGFEVFRVLKGADVQSIIDLCERSVMRDEGDEYFELLKTKLFNPKDAEKMVETYDDKWGAAVCIKDDDGYNFFGYASC